MRDSRPLIRRMVGLCFLWGPLAGLSGCDDQSVGYGPPQRPLDFIFFVHPGRVDAGAVAQLRAGVFVGPDLCWQVAGAGIQRLGDRLWISGVAHHHSLGACPQALAFETLTLTIPPLEPGDYFLTAGDLVDTLHVGDPGPFPAGKPFAAAGDICETDRGCVLFRCDHPNAEEIQGIVTRGLPIEPSPILTCRLLVAGTVAGTDTCAGRERNDIHLRGHEWREP